MIKKKYPQAKEPKQHGSNNIYVDAAIEAMQQAREKNERFSYLIVVRDEANALSGVAFNGAVSGIAATLAHFAENDKNLDNLIQLAGCDISAAWKDFGDFLDKCDKLCDSYMEELKKLKKKRPEDSK